MSIPASHGPEDLAPVGEMPPNGAKGAHLQEQFEAWVARQSPGTRIDSERELAKRFGVARMTVRLQLDRLAQRGLLYRHRGRGTFVAERRVAHTEHLTSFSEDMRIRHMEPGSRLLGIEEIRAGTTLAARLEISASSRVVRVRRVRTADGDPMATETSHVPARRFPGLLDEDLEHGSLYDLLERRYGVRVETAEQIVRSVLPTDYDAALLGREPHLPVLQIERTTRDTEGTVVEYVESFYRGDRYQVIMHPKRD